MPSPSSHTQTVRDRKAHTRGRKRKNRVNRDGTTRTAEQLFAKKPRKTGA